MVTIFPPLFSRAWKGTRGTRNDENRTRGGGQSKPRGACNRGGVATQHIVGELDEVKEKKKGKNRSSAQHFGGVVAQHMRRLCV